MSTTYGFLSGIEIAEAVERQREYQDLLRAKTEYVRRLSWLERRRLRKLEAMPRIHIDGFDPKPSDEGGQLNPNSYNLRLAPELLVYDVPILRDHERPMSPATWDEYALDMKRDNKTKAMKIPPEGLVLKPGRLYLGRTVEHTESFNLRPCLNGRSSIGRLGIMVHVTAGFGDVGFEGTWTLEIVVVHPIRVYAGVPICQIDYGTISPRHRTYQSRKYAGQHDVTASKLYLDFEDDKREQA